MAIVLTVQIESIDFHPNEQRGEDGAVYYLILGPCEECKTNPNHHVCASHEGMVHHYARQAFRRGAFGYRLDSTPEEQQSNRANVWGWDGNVEAPTITPSFLVHEGFGVPYRLHSFIRNGQLDLCGDSTVTLHPSPTACVHRDDHDSNAGS